MVILISVNVSICSLVPIPELLKGFTQCPVLPFVLKDFIDEGQGISSEGGKTEFFFLFISENHETEGEKQSTVYSI